MIDFDRTDPMLWGTGRSFGDGMEISETGGFSYYIGIGVGGTGQCEERGGTVIVEIDPYEEHSPEKEILTLAYENDGGGGLGTGTFGDRGYLCGDCKEQLTGFKADCVPAIRFSSLNGTGKAFPLRRAQGSMFFRLLLCSGGLGHPGGTDKQDADQQHTAQG